MTVPPPRAGHRPFLARLVIAAVLAAGALGGGVVAPAAPVLANNPCPVSEADLQSYLSKLPVNGTVKLYCSSPTTISFASNYKGTTGQAGTGVMTISQSVNLSVLSGSAPITFDGSNTNQLFIVNSGVTFGVDGLTLQHGLAAGSNYGGVMRVFGTLNLTNSTLVDNANTGADGGGALWFDGGSSGTIEGDTFSNNQSTGNGGGAISSVATSLTITNSTFSGNTAPSGGNGGEGGAIFIYPGQPATLQNDTFQGNSAGGYGGAVYTQGTMTLQGNVFSGNKVGNVPGSCAGTITDQGYNIAGDGHCFNGGPGDVLGDPQVERLGLRDNGGPTPTIALSPGSPAIDHIPLASCPSTDQRGAPRGDNSDQMCDSGAYETEIIPGGCPTSGAAATAGSLANLMAAQTYRATVELNCSTPRTIYFDGTGNSGPITVTTDTVLDASHSPAPITLDGGHTSTNAGVSLFSVNSGVIFGLTDFTLTHGGYGVIGNYGTLNVTGDTFTANTGQLGSDAIYNTGYMNVINSTFADNTGSLVATIDNAGTAFVTSSTIAFNSVGASTAAIFNESGGNLYLGNDLIAGNSPANCVQSGGTINDAGNNLDSDGTCATGHTGDTSGSPQLFPLANYGGLTPTLALGAGSAAIGAGSTSYCASSSFSGGLDQRGARRHTSSCDIGAFETGARPNWSDAPGSGPAITNLRPNSVTAGSPTTTLTIDGWSFSPGDNVYVGGVGYPFTYVTPTELTVSLPSSALSAPGIKEVEILAGGGNDFNQLPLYITERADTVVSFSTDLSTVAAGGTGPYTLNSITASEAFGSQLIQIAQYTGSPVAATLGQAQVYFDVHLTGSGPPDSVSIADCTPNDQSLFWYNPAAKAWTKLTNVSANNGCLSAAITNSTSPSLSDLTGAIFGGSTSGGATRALVSAASVTRHGATRVLRWTMAGRRGVLGYRIYANHHLLTRHLIPAHTSARYTYRTTHAGPYRLQIILANGTTRSIPIR